MSDVTLTPFAQSIRATVTPPGSKSLTNRALVMAAMTAINDDFIVRNILLADDTRVMLDALKTLGFKMRVDETLCTVALRGCGGTIPEKQANLFCGNSGTTIRFLAAFCALGQGDFKLNGIERMQQRPIGPLVDLLRNLGSRVEYLGQEGFPPIRIIADGLHGGIARYQTESSSQYLSAVLMASPYARHEVRVDLEGEQTSWPYVYMTLRLMDQFGLTPEVLRDKETGAPKQISIPLGHYTAHTYTVEPDASNAAYFLGIAALHAGSKITIPGLGTHSLQGDVQFTKILGQMGADITVTRESISVAGVSALKGVDVNLLDMPDQAQTLAVLALFAQGATTIRGLHTLRLKETDRLAALSTELQKFGARVEIKGNDTLIIHPPSIPQAAQVDTYDDHRMAMSFAMAGTRIQGVTIRDAQCVNKTYPAFFADLAKLSLS